MVFGLFFQVFRFGFSAFSEACCICLPACTSARWAGVELQAHVTGEQLRLAGELQKNFSDGGKNGRPVQAFPMKICFFLRFGLRALLPILWSGSAGASVLSQQALGLLAGNFR